MKFKILKKSIKSRARLGIIRTTHGEIETPAFVPVATSASIKGLNSREIEESQTQLVIVNTFHLHLKPGEDIVRKAGGLHKFMSWERPLMTDSGGFQVFSLGFGRDLQLGKVMKIFPGQIEELIKPGINPKNIKIHDDGVIFRSPLDGKELFLGPSESMDIQKKLGADMIFAFDECTPPLSSYEYIKSAVQRTHNWAKICRKQISGKQALFGITQGSKFEDLRKISAKFINSLGFDGYGIGGDLGESKIQSQKILGWTIPLLDENKPRHLLGIGHLEDMEMIIKMGIDLFDCTVPTHNARRGVAFTSVGELNMRRAFFLTQKSPLDPECSCQVCQTYKRNYISHLVRAQEITGLILLTYHNLSFFNKYVEKIRRKIKEGEI